MDGDDSASLSTRWGEFGFRADRINLKLGIFAVLKMARKVLFTFAHFPENNSWEAPAVCPLKSRKSPPKLKRKMLNPKIPKPFK